MDDKPAEEIERHYREQGMFVRRPDTLEDPFEIEGFFPHLGKRGMWLFFTASPIRDSQGRVIAAVETLQDITERKAILSQIVEGSSVAMFAIDQRHQITHWNGACAKLTGYSERKMKKINAPWEPFYDQQRPVLADLIVDSKSVEEIKLIYQDRGMVLRESFVRKGAFEVEGFFPKLGGRDRWLLFTAAPLVDSLGTIIGAVETLQDRTEQKRAEAEQERLIVADIVSEVVQVMSTELNADRLLETIVLQISKQLPCTYCTYFQREIKNGIDVLTPRRFSGFQESEPMPFRKGDGVAGWVLEHDESALIADVRTDKRYVPGREKLDGPRSMLAVPVRQGDQVIGVICADQDVYGWFDESHQRLVETLALHAGIAIQRATALDLLRNVGTRMVATQQLDEVLKQIVIGAIELTNATSGVIHLLSKDGQSIFHSVAWPQDFKHPESRLARAKSLTRDIIETGKLVQILDVRRDRRVNPVLRDRVRSMIGVPLKQADQTIGVLYLNDQNQHDFTETEKFLLFAFVDQAVIAIENVRLYKRMEILSDLSNAIADVEKDPGLRADVRS